MKHILSAIFLLLGISLVAQTSGEIIYEEVVVDIHKRLTGDRAQFKELVPQYRTVTRKLIFNEERAVYKPTEKTEEQKEVDHESGGRRMRMRQMSPNDVLWQNYQEGKRVEERNFMDKKFLISGKVHTYPWKLTGETKQVGKYLCKQATFQDSASNLMVWFTTMIPVPLGPSRYGQLPGLILHVDINEGERTITAQEILLKEIDAGRIMEPTKGKKVKQEEFRKLRLKKMEEMKKQHGGRGFRMKGH